ncbi:hypothetical protein RF11_07715 [Thelohanellus kitauei]|uniref:Uncharacterized protein n=1 Tax=Thelohanellus kitauei TaxID=669202 RepID=A0A0C2N065_THEKT|nr:hypothetical protein RF11_07715 [Thelohanellus kitauei]
MIRGYIKLINGYINLDPTNDVSTGGHEAGVDETEMAGAGSEVDTSVKRWVERLDVNMDDLSSFSSPAGEFLLYCRRINGIIRRQSFKSMKKTVWTTGSHCDSSQRTNADLVS